MNTLNFDLSTGGTVIGPATITFNGKPVLTVQAGSSAGGGLLTFTSDSSISTATNGLRIDTASGPVFLATED